MRYASRPIPYFPYRSCSDLIALALVLVSNVGRRLPVLFIRMKFVISLKVHTLQRQVQHRLPHRQCWRRLLQATRRYPNPLRPPQRQLQQRRSHLQRPQWRRLLRPRRSQSVSVLRAENESCDCVSKPAHCPKPKKRRLQWRQVLFFKIRFTTSL